MYCKLADLRGNLVEQIVACTATADSRTLKEIQCSLNMHDSTVISMPIRRANMSIFVTRKHPRGAEADLIRTIRRSTAPRVLVFCRKRQETERLASSITENNISASAYHSMVPERSQTLQMFLTGTRLLRLASVAVIT
jgi:ATP-dependent DNA helicase RecQ